MTQSDAVVAADQLEGLVAMYADSAFDLARRLGLDPGAAVTALAEAAAAEADRLADGEPATAAPVVVGEWLAGVRGDAVAAPRFECCAAAPTDDIPVADALTAVLLRDRHDLPLAAIAATLARGVDEAATALAAGRLAVFTAATGRPAPERGPVADSLADPGLLAEFVDGSALPHRALAVRRHVAACPDCADVVDAQRLARRLVASEPVAVLDDEQRTALLRRVSESATAVLPATADILAWTDDPVPPPPVSARQSMLVVGLVLLALVAGLALGGLLH